MPRHQRKKESSALLLPGATPAASSVSPSVPEASPQPDATITSRALLDIISAPPAHDASTVGPQTEKPVPAKRQRRRPKRTRQPEPTASAEPPGSTRVEAQPPASITHQRQQRPKSAGSKTAWMLKNTGTIISAIDIDSISPSAIPVSSSAGFELLCTYNWIVQEKLKKSGPEIYVPGCPPRWIPPTLPLRLRPDQGAQMIDQNAYRLPKHPFEPLFWALDIMNPSARLDDVDIVCNRNSLRKLLDIVSARRPDPFMMHLHVLGKTLFLTRKEKNARAMIRGAGNSGYGHNFEKACTEEDGDVGGSTSHHRVVRYDMGGLQCVVRFEVDASYDSEYEGIDNASYDHSFEGSQIPAKDSAASLTDIMQKLSLLGVGIPSVPRSEEAIAKGTVLPSSNMAEMKTTKNLKDINQYLPQLWFGRTPHLLVARQPAGDGIFREVVHTHAGSHFAAWEDKNQEQLRKLVGILKQLKDIMGKAKNGAAVLLYEKKGGPLQVLEMKNPTQVLPEECRKYWDAETA